MAGRLPDTPPTEDALHGDVLDRTDPRMRGREAELTQAENAQADREDVEQADWLGLARQSYDDSTQFVDSSLRAQWERNERAFQNRHRPGSKYYSDTYKHRTKIYRPKTRAAIRQGEAQIAASLFSNEDVVSIRAVDEDNQLQRANAELIRELVQYRATTSDPSVGLYWFLTAVGAYQDAQKMGFVISKQWWEYETVTEEIRVPERDENKNFVYDAEGRQQFKTEYQERAITDRPRIDLYPPENVRIDRAADWRDPVNSSPYVIIRHPMYAGEVKARMDADDPKTGRKAWLKVDDTVLKQAARDSWDSTRMTREDRREDPKESTTPIREFQVVWVHENFMRYRGIDYVYFTAGTTALLSEPVRVEEMYAHADQRERPLAWGTCIIETHKTFPAGKPQLMEGLQDEANDMANLRLDNIKLALNKRFLVRRGRQVDLQSLTKSSSGRITLVTDIEGDVKEMEVRDVTSASLNDIDRINLDTDEIVGNFSPSSVQSNRRMNETVGGMQMLRGASTMIGELDLRTFSETWLQRVVRQLIRMEQRYETDTVLLGVAASKAKLFQRYGVSEITDDMLNQNVTTTVNIGLGATDPVDRLNKLAMGMKALAALFGEEMKPMLVFDEFVKEVMAPLGYRDGRRFFRLGNQDPMVTMLQQQMKKLQQELEKRTEANQARVESARLGAEARVAAAEVSSKRTLQGDQMAMFAQIIQALVKDLGARDGQSTDHQNQMERQRAQQRGQMGLQHHGSMMDLLSNMAGHEADMAMADNQGESAGG